MRRFVAALVLLTVGSGAASPAAADTYPRQPGLDALHYVFRLTLSDASDEITGRTTIRLRVADASVSTLDLDLTSVAAGRGMAVIGVTSRGRAVQHTHENNRLRVTLEGTPARGSEIELEVEYRGIPATGLYIGANKFGERVFFGVSWPDLARQWLPTIDHPSDKATSEFLVTAPSHYQVVANGLLVEEVDLAGGTRRTHWRQSVPISTWLNTIGVARFAVHHAGEAAGVPLQTWVFTADRENGQRDFEGPARAAMSFYAATFGPYSYEKLANLQASGMTGGNETASAILYGEASITGEEKIRNLVAHEIAHQWFGNSVTESDWDDIWLSEGFATYSTLMFVEHTEGRDAFVAGLERAKAAVLETQQKMPETAILHRNLSDTTKILNRLVYQKGGWTLHMLRGVIGHEAFVEGLRDYYRTYRNGLATTDDFRQTVERASGKELGWFFSQWLTRSGIPDIYGTWRYDVKARQVVVELAQRQAGESYRLPLDVAMTWKDRPDRRIEKVELDGRERRWTFAVDTPPDTVSLDPDTWVLMQATFDRHDAAGASTRGAKR